MIVVSDTSVICNLFLINQLELLPAIFEEVIIPQKVFEELLELKNFDVDISPIVNADFLEAKIPKNTEFISQLLADIDEGEAHAIALALELKADLLLIDELKGRAIAKQWGLEITGLLGVLLRGKKNGIISEIKPILDKLISHANFFIDENLYQLILKKAGE